jgi:hypothetical protein
LGAAITWNFYVDLLRLASDAEASRHSAGITKPQAPNSRETPITKFQQRTMRLGLGFGYSLVIGDWGLVIPRSGGLVLPPDGD